LKNDRVYILRESVVKITQMLSGKGIKVTQQGVNAYVKADHNGTPILVNLPYLPDNASEDLCNAIQGFLDHEVAHILFTEFPIMGKAMKQGRQIGFLLNALEDPRIEKCMAERFQGCAYNLANTGKFYLDKFVVPKMQEAAKAGNANEVINVLMVPMIRAMSGQQVFKEFMKDKWSVVEPVYERIKDLEPKIEAATSTSDCLELAVEIGKRLQGDKKGEGEGEGKGSSSKKSTSASSSGSKGEKDKGESKSSAGKSKPEKPEEKDEKGGASEGEKEDEEGEGKGKPSGKDADEKKDEEEETPAPGEDEDDEEEPTPSDPEPTPDEDEDDESDVKAPEEKPEEEPEEPAEVPAGSDDDGSESDDEDVSLGEESPIWSELDKDGANGYDESMSRVISDETVKCAEDADYVVFTKEYDVIEKLPIGSGYDPKMTSRLVDAVEHMVAPLQKDLERAVAARSLSQRSHGHRSGKLHASNLTRLRFGDPRVFSRKHESESKDVAVELVVDASGSMSGSKIHTACQSAYALSAVLDRLSIKNEVICFTTKGIGGTETEMYEQQSKYGIRFSRVEGIYMPILKGYDERMTAQIKERFGWLPNTRILRSNVDGESIEIAARRLMQRREHSKVMIVLSDGYPAAAGGGNLHAHLKKTVKEIEKAGVRLVGIGIESEAVRDFYPRNLVLNKVDELPEAVMKQLRHLLMV
jgi:cobaltochelatase CobT